MNLSEAIGFVGHLLDKLCYPVCHKVTIRVAADNDKYIDQLKKMNSNVREEIQHEKNRSL